MKTTVKTKSWRVLDTKKRNAMKRMQNPSADEATLGTLRKWHFASGRQQHYVCAVELIHCSSRCLSRNRPSKSRLRRHKLVRHTRCYLGAVKSASIKGVFQRQTSTDHTTTPHTYRNTVSGVEHAQLAFQQTVSTTRMSIV
jgi:hypothetical protein